MVATASVPALRPPPPLLLPLLLLVLCWCAATRQEKDYAVVMDVSAAGATQPGDLSAFWASTGFSAPSAALAEAYMLSREMEWNLAYVGALPRSAIRQVRAHWLLQLVHATRTPGGPSSSSWRWDFARLDRFLDVLVRNGLRPGFEVMGNPVVVEAGGAEAEAGAAEGHGLITDITAQAGLWQRLVRDTVVHCGGRYGRRAVQQWRFETWNEPDLAQYNAFNWTLQGYMAYFNATVRGLREAERALGVPLRLGGPAGTFKARRRHPICWHALEHCDRMAAANQSCGLDFLSFHGKGDGSSRGVVARTLGLLRHFVDAFPHLATTPFANDEADPLTGWWRSEPWRGDRRYAGLVVNAIADLQDQWRRRAAAGCRPRRGGGADACLPPVEVLSNDNGFLETDDRHFQQRTLLASFRHGAELHLVRKAVLTATAMLSFVAGDVDLPVTSSCQPPMPAALQFKTLASLRRRRAPCHRDRDGGCGPRTTSTTTSEEPPVLSVLVAFNNETHPVDDGDLEAAGTARVALTIRDFVAAAAPPPPPGSASRPSVLVRVASLRRDPMQTWLTAGSPASPGRHLRRKLRLAELPQVEQVLRIRPKKGTDDTISVSLNVTLGSISLVQIFMSPADTPLKVINLRAMNVTYGEVLLLWANDEHQSEHVTDYRVSFRRDASLPYAVVSPRRRRRRRRRLRGDGVRGHRGHRHISSPWHLFPAFHHAPPDAAPASASEPTRGQYRVSAVSAWGAVGPAAELQYPPA